MRDIFEGQDARIDRRKATRTLIFVLALVVALLVVRPSTWGSIATIVGLMLMIVLHEAGHFLVAKRAGMKVTEFFVSFGPRLWSFRRGETEYGVKAIPVGGYVKIIGMSNLDEVDPADEARTYRARPYRWRVAVAAAGPLTNLFLGFLLIFAMFVGYGRPSAAVPVLSRISAGSPAAQIGLREGDRIVAIESTPIEEWSQVTDIVSGRLGEPTSLEIVRDGTRRKFTVEPAEHPDRPGKGFLGVSPSAGPREGLGPVQSFTDAFTETKDAGVNTVKGLGGFVSNFGDYSSNLFSSDSDTQKRIDAKRPISPVGLGRVASQAARSGLEQVLWLLATLNISLGILNLLPLPPLDGGHIVIATYEKLASMIRRRRVQVDMAKLLPITFTFILLLAFLTVTSIYLDVARPQPNPF